MFGNINDQMENLVEKNQWEKITKKLDGADAKTRLAAAAACAKTKDGRGLNILISLLKDNDAAVQLQAIKSIGMVGNVNAKTHLQWISEHLPEGREGVKEAIQEAIMQIGKWK